MANSKGLSQSSENETRDEAFVMLLVFLEKNLLKMGEWCRKFYQIKQKCKIRPTLTTTKIRFYQWFSFGNRFIVLEDLNWMLVISIHHSI